MLSPQITIETGKPAEITLATIGPQAVDLEASGGTAGEEYEGSYTVTPSDETQVLRTGNRVCAQNIVINPIPENYGLITWDGAVLTVS